MSLILADLVDLAVHRFKHGCDPGDFWCLWEPNELIGGHGQVDAWGLVDIMAIDMDEFIVEVALEWTWSPLRVELFVASSFSQHDGNLICLVLRTVGIPIDTRGTVLIGSSILWRAVDIDIENPSSLKG